MKLHRFFGNFDLAGRTVRIADAEMVNQFRNVLKLGVGEMVVLCDGKGNEGIGTILKIHKDAVDVGVSEVRENTNEPERRVTLYMALLKRENFELAVQKATELGVTRIVPMITARTVKLDFKRERAEKIAKEAAEQSGRGIIPEIAEIAKYPEALASVMESGLSVFFDPSGVPCNTLKNQLAAVQQVGIFIGPEGGWDEKEIALAREKGCVIASLGTLILRGETAAIVAVYEVLSS